MVGTGLEIDELRILQAAVGWLELGMPREGLEELDTLASALRQSPEALEIRWLILSDLRDWDGAAAVSGQLIECAADRPSSWLHHAYATRRSSTGGLSAAFQVLSSVASRFPQEAIIAYNLACYACQLGRGAVETLDWFERAVQAGNRKDFVEMALKDSDLEPVWPLIRQGSRKSALKG